MVPKHVYETLEPEEQKLWHSHEFEVSSGMLCVPRPSGGPEPDEWENPITAWQPVLMRSVTHDSQIDLDAAVAQRNMDYGVDHKKKAMKRANGGVKGPGIRENADSWWKGAGVQGNDGA